jgi:transglutaminase-like putative cysteine protease
MSKWLKVFILALSFSLRTTAGEGEYAVSKIAPALLKNANAVLRLEEQRFEIINLSKAVYKNHYVITVLNENGDYWAGFSEYYDKFQKIESIEGILYDASGNQLKKIKTRDAEDLSGVSDGNLIDDNRIKRHNFYHRVYPYTIEYITTIEYSSTLFFPKWIPQGREKLSVEKSSMCIVTPSDYQFRFKEFNYVGIPVKATEKDGKIATSWSVKDMPAILREPYSPLWHELTTVVIFGPTNFQAEDYKGNMTSWSDFGKFVYALKKDRDVLPDNIKQQVHQLVDGVTDTKKKVAILYAYLQKNTRYTSIQLGIGGWRPFEAKFVATKAYGDCKALTNYMFSLLKEVNIPSYYALIRAGENAGYITDDFPSQQFNHVILCVPVITDTIWLECTSPTLSPGYLSGFTSNRFALLVDETGGRLVRTPVYGLAENQQERKITALLDKDGTLQVNTVTRYSGQQQDDIHGMINNLSKDKVKEYLLEQLDFATYDISDFKYTENKTLIPAIDEFLDITVNNYAAISGKRLFILPNIMTRNNQKLSADEQRKYDMIFNASYRDVDSIEITLPESYTAESIPQDVSISSRFGKYQNKVKLSGDKLFYYRSIEKYAGRYPASEYADLVKFYEATYKADRNKVVLIKNETTKGF